MKVRLMYGTWINVWKNLKREARPGPGKNGARQEKLRKILIILTKYIKIGIIAVWIMK